MILKKVIINDKTFYKPISYQDAFDDNIKNDLIFTIDEFSGFNNQEGNLDTSKYFKMMSQVKSIFEEIRNKKEVKSNNNELEMIDEDDSNHPSVSVNFKFINDEDEEKDFEFEFALDDEDKINEKDSSLIFAKAFNNIFNKDDNSKSNKLMSALPFMDNEDRLKLVDTIINNPEEYNDINLALIMPFLSTEACDKLFMNLVIENKNGDYPLVAIASFVSKSCLSHFVDEYEKGRFQDIKMDFLYPFMDSKDVKRVFNYILLKK